MYTEQIGKSQDVHSFDEKMFYDTEVNAYPGTKTEKHTGT